MIAPKKAVQRIIGERVVVKLLRSYQYQTQQDTIRISYLTLYESDQINRSYFPYNRIDEGYRMMSLVRLFT